MASERTTAPTQDPRIAIPIFPDIMIKYESSEQVFETREVGNATTKIWRLLILITIPTHIHPTQPSHPTIPPLSHLHPTHSSTHPSIHPSAHPPTHSFHKLVLIFTMLGRSGMRLGTQMMRVARTTARRTVQNTSSLSLKTPFPSTSSATLFSRYAPPTHHTPHHTPHTHIFPPKQNNTQQVTAAKRFFSSLPLPSPRMELTPP